LAERTALRGEAELLNIFDDRSDPVIGGKGKGPFASADLLIEEPQKFTKLTIGAIRDVLDFQAVRSEGMAHEIVGREVDAEQVGKLVLPKLLAGDDGAGRFQRHVVAKGGDHGQIAELQRGELARWRQLMRELAGKSLGRIFPGV